MAVLRIKSSLVVLYNVSSMIFPSEATLFAHGPNIVIHALLLPIVIACDHVNVMGVTEISMIEFLLLLAPCCLIIVA